MIIVNFIYLLRTEMNLVLDVEENNTFSAAEPTGSLYLSYDF